jgi:neutral ceramidase
MALGLRRALAALVLAAATPALPAVSAPSEPGGGFRAGGWAVEIPADDSMVIGGGIGPGKATGQEGKLRASAVVVRKGAAALALVSCDVLMVNRDYLDEAAWRIEAETGIPFENVLINATHTHHAPSTVTIHGYQRDELFCGRLRDAVVEAVVAASGRCAGRPSRLVLAAGEEATVGQNSRLRLADGTIYWVGPRDDALGPSGPFDPALPVIGFRGPGGGLEALIFNHSTHCIGGREAGKRSPGFYGLAAQDLEPELGGTVVFLAGAFGSTHNLTLDGGEMACRMGEAVQSALRGARESEPRLLASRKREIRYRVRDFDEAREDQAVSVYCRKRTGKTADSTIEVFRKMRSALSPHRGEERASWVQALLIGEVAVVGAPGELFTKLGLDIKRRSPFALTLVAGVANDYIGYIPDREAYALGGYQVWTGFHSFVAQGTGELIVEEALRLLEELKAGAGAQSRSER